MQTSNRLFDDLARLANSAIGTLSGVKAEVEAQVRQQLERVLSRMDLVSREEFEAVKAMATKARAEQEDLAARLAALEARLAEADPEAAQGRAKAKSQPKKSGD